ncbi:MAG: UDP-glucose 4-epimerase [uncultured Solirubrobacteraceae bacterium]|uniref:UDP-glucose 4-epimerase n=1 Tax=uncultured Solirubrobacteraceae bacterium TaxID=1162706 RepID=A0A6J4U4I3_9ACTN|nr:MAG: UDP-glucose 4-epimerase [uncultured Solirubrobacteraceae bacterium]
MGRAKAARFGAYSRAMKALVTGGAGFIGSNLVDGLLADGHEVVVLDDLSTGRESNLDRARAGGVRLHVGSIADPDAVAAVMEADRPEAVFHLAAQIDVRRSVADPAFDVRVNVEGTAVLLEAARRAGVRRFVFSSTGGAIYGEADAIPTAEDAPIRPLAAYGQDKFAAEGLCHLYRRLHGMSTVCLRYSNVYGPRQDPLGEGGVIAIFCGKAVLGGEPVIFGDGRQTRDFMYVGDVVAANLAALESDTAGSINVATGVEVSVLDLLDVLGRLRPEAELVPRHEPARLGEIERSCLDPALAAELLGWRAQTGLEDGLRATLDAVA